MKYFLGFILLFFVSCSDGEKEVTEVVKVQEKVSSVNLSFVNSEMQTTIKRVSKNTLDIDIEDKIVFLNFFTTRCHFCIAELPYLIDLQKKYKKNVQFIGISLDPYISDNKISKFIKKYEINYPVNTGVSSRDWSDLIGTKISPTPFSIMYDSSGKYVTHYNGAVLGEMIDIDIQNLVK